MSIAELVLESARRAGVERVTQVVLELGVAAPVEPEALKFTFPLVAADTALHGADLVIQRIPLLLRCQACGTQYAPASPVEACPACGGFLRETLQGREMRVLRFEAG